MATFDSFIKGLTLDMLAGAARHPDPKVRLELAEMYWDLKYIYLFGIPKNPVPDLPIPWPPEPQPDPSPWKRMQLHEDILVSLIDSTSGEPDPQANINSVLRDPRIRLEAASGLHKRLNLAVEQLALEIKRLEKTLERS
jgi:hypothetical protein